MQAEATDRSLDEFVAEALRSSLPARPDAAALEAIDEHFQRRLHAIGEPLRGGDSTVWSQLVFDAREACTELQAIVLPASKNLSARRRLDALVAAFSRRLEAIAPSLDSAPAGRFADLWRASVENLSDEWSGLVAAARELL